MYLGLLASWVATCGSLFMSQVLGWLPCEWCWYQRIAMYPTSVLLAVGLARRDWNIPKYALWLAVPGAAASIYHILLQKVPAIKALEQCKSGVPCSQDYLWQLGIFPEWMTIPMLALIAFVIIIVASLIALRSRASNVEEGVEGLPPVVFVAAIVAAVVGLFAFSGALYARNQPAQVNPLNTGASSTQAATLYANTCQSCHGPVGTNMKAMRAEFIKSKSELELMNIISAGRKADALDNFSKSAMPANGGRIGMTQDELLALARYLKENVR
jgi:disulfide bond formation protein DsbB